MHIKTGQELFQTFNGTSENNDPIYRSFCSNCGSPVFVKNPIVMTGLLDIYDGESAKNLCMYHKCLLLSNKQLSSLEKSWHFPQISAFQRLPFFAKYFQIDELEFESLRTMKDT